MFPTIHTFLPKQRLNLGVSALKLANVNVLHYITLTNWYDALKTSPQTTPLKIRVNLQRFKNHKQQQKRQTRFPDPDSATHKLPA